jgi:hypothetical protein
MNWYSVAKCARWRFWMRAWTVEQMLLLVLYRTCRQRRRYKGVCLVPAVRGRETRFLTLIQNAMDLLQSNDPIRFSRLQRYVRVIADRRAGASWYHYPSGVLESDISAYPSMFDPSAYCAAVLVHESTHGLLQMRSCGKGTKRLWVRSEKICHREAVVFCQKLPKGRTLTEHFKRLSREEHFDPVEIQRLLHRRMGR